LPVFSLFKGWELNNMDIDTQFSATRTSSKSGAIFQKKINLADSENSDAIILPYIQLDSIAVNTTGDITIFATASSLESIENDTAVWEEWDGTSLFNRAIFALKAEGGTGPSSVEICVRGSFA